MEEAAPAVAPVETPVINEQSETESETPTFVVIRSGHRVSDKNYPTSDDPAAISERDFWAKVVKKWSYPEPVDIVQFDKKKHRVW